MSVVWRRRQVNVVWKRRRRQVSVVWRNVLLPAVTNTTAEGAESLSQPGHVTDSLLRRVAPTSPTVMAVSGSLGDGVNTTTNTTAAAAATP